MLRKWGPWIVGGVVALVLLYGVAIAALSAVGRSFIYHPDPALIAAGPNDPAGIVEVRIATPDRQTLRAWWMPPKPGKPVILYFDGNGGRLHLQGYRFAKAAEEGVGMFALAYRGYSGSTGEPSEGAFHADARLAYDWVSAHVDPKRIVAHGFSLGTGVAVQLAVERPVRALILEAPYTAIVDIAQEHAPMLPVGMIMKDQYLSREWIGRVHVPVMIAHGDADTVIPIRHGEALFARANEPKVFVKIAGGGHSDLVSRGLYEDVWRFLGISRDADRDG